MDYYLHIGDRRDPIHVETDSLSGLKTAMFELQRHYEAGEIIAKDSDGQVEARMTFEWVDE